MRQSKRATIGSHCKWRKPRQDAWRERMAGALLFIAMTHIPTHVPAVDQAFLLLLIVLCLGTCLIRAFWELEQVRMRRISSSSRATKRD